MKKIITLSILLMVPLLLVTLASPVYAKRHRPTVTTVNNPIPATINVLPNTIAIGSLAPNIIVNGQNFISGSTINVNGSARTTTYISATQLTASLLSSDVAVAGNLSITVTSPTPGGGTSNVQTFTVISLAQPPSNSPLQLGAFNANAGTVRAYFNGWTDNASCAPAGQQTFIYWENTGYSLDAIINGSQDANINRFASTVCPGTILNVFAEVNGNWDEWGGTVGTNTPAKVILAWQRIHNLIGNKVKYAWVINNSSVPDIVGNQVSDYYPGANYVDIVGVDGFNWGGTTFMQAIAPAFPAVKSFNKPIWITSFGTGQTNQASWITDAIIQAKANNIGGLIYFSYPDPADGIDFTLSAQGLAAYHL